MTRIKSFAMRTDFRRGLRGFRGLKFAMRADFLGADYTDLLFLSS